MNTDYLESSKKQFEYYKMLGDKAISQLPDDKLFWQYNAESNSIATIVNHLHGNMLSRWTDFLTTDGEKEWRQRDAEFENGIANKDELLLKWNEGWNCLFTALNSLQLNDLSTIIYIRNQGHTVTEAINRQLAHYPYHVGQMVFIGKMICNEKWISLSIPKGNSKNYNLEKFSKAKRKEHFTEEFIEKRITINNEEYQILNTTTADLERIYWLFEEAIAYQKRNNYVGWNSYDKDFIKLDIEQKLQFKVCTGNDMLCIFSICFNDELIWRTREKGDAIYLHRIVVNPNFKGQKQFEKVLAWAIKFAKERQVSYLRMDTWADNSHIINYYKSYGFKFLENYTTPNTLNLPLQHRNLNVALLEMKL